MGQFPSNYEGMGNNPVNEADPTGGDWYKYADGNLKFDKNVRSQYDLDHFGRLFENSVYQGEFVQGKYSNGRSYFGNSVGELSELLKEVKVTETYTEPAAIVNSISAGFAFGGGFGFELSRIQDRNGNANWFFSSSVNIGLGIGAGFNHREITNFKNYRFKNEDYERTSTSLSASIVPLGLTSGGNNDDWNDRRLDGKRTMSMVVVCLEIRFHF